VVTRNATSITIAWNTATGTVVGYRLARGIVVTATTTGLEWKFGRLSCGQTYALSVWAYNASGSGPSSVVTESTASCRSKKLRAAVVARYRPRKPR
jgi:Fibronectin type III domain